jgi:hypothetical protein
MYVLIHKDRVLVGPRDWNRPMFVNAIQKLNLEPGLLPRKNPTDLPITFDADTYITKARMEIPEHNAKTETYYGPFWDFADVNLALGSYRVKERPIDSIREILIREAAQVRYDKEVAGTTATIQDTEVSLDTSRDGRNIFIQKYTLMGDAETVNWKFPEGWLTLTKTELGTVVAAGSAHIQGAFDWEKSIVEQIQAAETAAELDAIQIQPVIVEEELSGPTE